MDLLFLRRDMLGSMKMEKEGKRTAGKKTCSIEMPSIRSNIRSWIQHHVLHVSIQLGCLALSNLSCDFHNSGFLSCPSSLLCLPCLVRL